MKLALAQDHLSHITMAASITISNLVTVFYERCTVGSD